MIRGGYSFFNVILAIEHKFSLNVSDIDLLSVTVLVGVLSFLILILGFLLQMIVFIISNCLLAFEIYV